MHFHNSPISVGSRVACAIKSARVSLSLEKREKCVTYLCVYLLFSVLTWLHWQTFRASVTVCSRCLGVVRHIGEHSVVVVVWRCGVVVVVVVAVVDVVVANVVVNDASLEIRFGLSLSLGALSRHSLLAGRIKISRIAETVYRDRTISRLGAAIIESPLSGKCAVKFVELGQSMRRIGAVRFRCSRGSTFSRCRAISHFPYLPLHKHRAPLDSV